MKTLKRIPFFLVTALATLIVLILCLAWLNQSDFFSVQNMLSGFDYLPPLWLVILILPVCLIYLVMKRWRVALALFGIVLVFFLLFDDLSIHFLSPRQPEKTEKYEKLSVLTYNVRYYSYGEEKLSGFFKKSNADVILLSESVLDSARSACLQNALPDYSLISDHGHDTAILSRYPVLSYHIVPLPSPLASLSGSNDLDKLSRAETRRAFVHAVINANGIPVNVLSIRLIAGRAKNKTLKENLKWGRFLLRTQDREQKTILDYLASLDGPVVFGGDLNAPPSARVIKKFGKIAHDAYLNDHLFGNFTFRTRFPTMRLDYLFHSPDLIPVDSKIIRVMLSDHFPVKCDFLVPKKAALALK